MKAEGVRPGVNDYLLPVARSGYVGLMFELKSPGKYPNKNQRWFMARFTAEGWLTFAAWDWVAASTLIEDYLQGRGKISRSLMLGRGLGGAVGFRKGLVRLYYVTEISHTVAWCRFGLRRSSESARLLERIEVIF